MQLTLLDWSIIGTVLVIVMSIGWWAGKQGKGHAEDYFLGGRSMP